MNFDIIEWFCGTFMKWAFISIPTLLGLAGSYVFWEQVKF